MARRELRNLKRLVICVLAAACLYKAGHFFDSPSTQISEPEDLFDLDVHHDTPEVVAPPKKGKGKAGNGPKQRTEPIKPKPKPPSKKEPPLPKYDSEGFWTESPTLVSSPGPGGRDLYNHTFPYNGTIMHYVTSIHPSKTFGSEDYVMSSLWFVEAEDSYPSWAVQAEMSTNWTRLQFECTFDKHIMSGQPHTQGIREDYVVIECPLPKWANTALKTATTSRKRYEIFKKLREMDIGIRVWAWLYEDEMEKSIGEPDVINETQDGQSFSGVILTHHQITSWETPKKTTQFSICTAPIRLNDGMTLGEFLEWRIHHLYQGATVVHWYSRQPELKSWVEKVNEELGIEDTYQNAPMFMPHYYRQHIHRLNYPDQSQWQQECIIRYGFSDVWQGHFDLDEFLMVTDEPEKNSVLKALEDTSENVGSLTVYQVYYGGEKLEDAPVLEKYPAFPRNGWTMWEPFYWLGNEPYRMRYTKAVHRTAGLRTLWVHASLTMGQGWYNHYEEVGKDTPGVLQLIHSRKSKYDDLKYTVEYTPNEETKTHWKILGKQLEGLEELHELPKGT